MQERAASQRRMYIVSLLRCAGKVPSVFRSSSTALLVRFWQSCANTDGTKMHPDLLMSLACVRVGMP